MTFARTGGRALVPVASVDTVRSERRLVDPTGRVLVKLADDTVTAELLAPPGSGAPSTRTSWREIEIEIVDGPRSLLDVIDPILREHGTETVQILLEARPRHRRETTPGSTADDGPDAKKRPRLQRKKASAADVALAHIGVQVAQVPAQDLPVRLDTPGQRAQDARRHAPAAQRADHVQAALRRRRDPAPARRAQVARRGTRCGPGRRGDARPRLRRRRGTRATRSRAQADASRAELTEAYRAAHDRVLAELDGDRYHQILVALHGLVEQPPFRKRGRPTGREGLPGPRRAQLRPGARPRRGGGVTAPRRRARRADARRPQGRQAGPLRGRGGRARLRQARHPVRRRHGGRAGGAGRTPGLPADPRPAAHAGDHTPPPRTLPSSTAACTRWRTCRPPGPGQMSTQPGLRHADVVCADGSADPAGADDQLRVIPSDAE